MAGYSEARIFRSNKQGQFTRFMHGITAIPFDDHLKVEKERLAPVFDAMSTSLRPHGIKPSYSARLSPQHIGGTYSDTARANGFLTFGMPIIIPESNFLYPTIKSVFVDGKYGNNITKHLKPDSYKRMFWTSAFGLLAVKDADTPYKHSKTYIFPTNTIPQDFLDIEGINPVIKAAAKLSAIVNHDYFHQMVYGGIHENFGHRNDTAPLNKYIDYNDRKQESAVGGYRLDRQFKVSAWDVEPWAMRLQAEILQEMVKKPDNAMEQAVDELCAAIASCPALLEAQGKMSSPPISPQDYATRLLAFNLLRATPLDHQFTQVCIEKIKSALAPSTNTLSNGVEETFDHMYETNYKYVLFGKNDTDWDPEEYSRRTKALSGHAVVLAQRDCEQAFRLQAEYEVAASNNNSARSKRLARREKIQMYEGLFSNPNEAEPSYPA